MRKLARKMVASMLIVILVAGIILITGIQQEKKAYAAVPFARSWNILDFITSPFDESPFTMYLLIGFA